MTLLVRRRALISFSIVTVIVAVGIAAAAHVVIGSVQDAPGVEWPGEAKILAERVLLLGIVGAVVVVAACIAIVSRAVQLSVQLQKLVEMNRLTGFSPEEGLNRMGDVGQKIVVLYRQLSEVSNKRSLKISALTALNEYLLAESKQHIAVIDASGHVVQMSNPLAERGRKMLGVHLDSLIPDAQTNSAVLEMNRTRAQVVRERQGDSILFTPVVNRAGDVAYGVVTLTRTLTDQMREQAEAATKGNGGKKPAARR
ncbi:MAG: hypothetical protein EA382_15715, partial [Spirochaetaceae bacterium]